eukprot:119005_1
MGNSVGNLKELTIYDKYRFACYGFIRDIEFVLRSTIPDAIYIICFEYYNTLNTTFIIEKIKTNVIYLKNCYGKYLSATECNDIHVNGHGSKSNYSQWKIAYRPYMHVDVQNNNTKAIKLQNIVTGKYLRIYNNIYRPYHVVDIGGSAGVWTLFNVIKTDPYN